VKPLKEWITLPFETRPKRIMFRVDAGRILNLSFGHISRCLILSKELRSIFDSSHLFLMRNYKEGTNYAKQAGENVKVLPKQNEKAYILKVAYEFKPDCIIVDLPTMNNDMEVFLKLKNQGINFFFIDDVRFQNPGANIYLNSNILAEKKIKRTNTDQTHYFLGPQFFIFDNTLIEKGTPFSKDKIFKVVLSFGGSDPTDLMLKVIKVLVNLDNIKAKYYAIIGPGYPNEKNIKNIVDEHEGFYLIKNPKNIIPYFQGCDFVICAGGRTIYELLYLEKNFMPIATAEHELKIIKELMDINIVDFGIDKWFSEIFIENMERVYNNWIQKMNIG